MSALFRRGFTVIERQFSETFDELLAEVSPDVILAVLDVREPDDVGLLRYVASYGGGQQALALIEPYDERLATVALDAGALVALSVSASPGLIGAQVVAILRAAQQRAAEELATEIVAGDLAIDLDRRHVVYAGSTVELTKSEFDILALLARNSGRVLGPAEIVTGIGQAPESAAQARGMVKVHVSHLRTKLARVGAPDYVVTVRGVGYLFERRSHHGDSSNGTGRTASALA